MEFNFEVGTELNGHLTGTEAKIVERASFGNKNGEFYKYAVVYANTTRVHWYMEDDILNLFDIRL